MKNVKTLIIFLLFPIVSVACRTGINASTIEPSPPVSPTLAVTTTKLFEPTQQADSTFEPTFTSTAEILPTDHELLIPTLIPPVEPTQISSSSRQIAFVSEIALNAYQIHIMSVDDRNVDLLTHGNLNFSAPSWSPNGQKILFQSSRQGSPLGEDIWIMNTDSTEQLNLTNDFAYNSSPDWSPDSQRIVFSSERDGNAEIYVINADGSGRIRLTNNSASDSNPVWSPDNKTVAFVSDHSGKREIYTMQADGSNVVQLTQSIEGAYSPQWSSSGKQIVFIMDNAIWIMQSDGTTQHRISANVNVTLPTLEWSPNDQQVIFTGTGSKDIYSNVYLIDVEDDNLFRLTDDSQPYTSGSFSPDGTLVAISGGEYLAVYDLYIINLETLETTRLTDNSVLDCCPVWRPANP